MMLLMRSSLLVSVFLCVDHSLASSSTVVTEPYAFCGENIVNEFSTDVVYFDGLSSGAFSTILDNYVDTNVCYASFSCAHMIKNVFIHEWYCYGSQSCLDLLDYNSSSITCSAFASCTNSVLNLTSGIDCYAAGACAMVSSVIGSHTVNEYEEIYISGLSPFSLYGATMDSKNATIESKSNSDNVMNVHLYAPFSGYGMIFTCKSGTQCWIYCWTDYSCFGMTYICESGAVCETADCSNDYGKNDWNGIYCPYLDGDFPEWALKTRSIIYDNQLNLNKSAYEEGIQVANYLLGTYDSNISSTGWDGNIIDSLTKIGQINDCNDIKDYYNNTVGCLINCDSADSPSHEKLEWANGGFIKSECFDNEIYDFVNISDAELESIIANITKNRKAVCFTGSGSAFMETIDFVNDSNHDIIFDGNYAG